MIDARFGPSFLGANARAHHSSSTLHGSSEYQDTFTGSTVAAAPLLSRHYSTLRSRWRSANERALIIT
ncbi:hypothetical protein [Paramicrobacterium humi]|uniref:hypothetical protein n=1 Tax=Paramicrobacterium humi TaxID=640635 RepID=UPI0011600764|nr:hypothetical protein [Microbacterium humi]